MYDISVKQNNNSISVKNVNSFIELIENNRNNDHNAEINLNQIQLAIKNIEPRNIFNEKNKFEIEISGFFKYVLNCCKKPKDQESFDILNIGKKFLIHKLDLTYFLKMIDQINSLKSLLLKPYQIFMLDNQKKINLFSKKEKIYLEIRDNENLSIENEMQIYLIQIIVQIIREKSLENIDYNFYENIDPYLKKFIDDLVIMKKESDVSFNSPQN